MLIEIVIPMILLSLTVGALICLIKSSNKIDKQIKESTVHSFIDTGDLFNVVGDIAHVCYDPKTEIVYLISEGQYASYFSVLYNDNKQPMDLLDYKNTYKK